MQEAKQLLTTLKAELKAQGITYREIAEKWDLSEGSIKRLLNDDKISLARLLDLCQLVEMNLAELSGRAHQEAHCLRELTEAQEAKLVENPRLLLVATCVINHWRLEDITQKYRLTTPECLQLLFQLEQMGIIHLLPNNRIRLRIARDFSWRRNGAITRYFTEHCRDDFLADGFCDHEGQFFIHGMLTEVAKQQMLEELQKLRRRFAECHEDSLHAAITARRGTAMLVSLRNWEPNVFAQLRREPLGDKKSGGDL
ncbi:helix-turn-helix domain-containing protein [Suttonella ornithocola]|uniref:HTH cro/C1-type domain-containing protein n=1 Tax=Suttonella ornithocola TaxID=279832 RepID=A0A380N128_9GAMM|nr:helix-turn-helix transcriptional regulator [Suttonella ornithocola]SUO97833.1 Uncharacterised protein [Suttonella ornithocola]